MESDPWFKSKLIWDRAGREYQFLVPHDVFSTLQIDDGTRVLLDNLPTSKAHHVLDMGCGYGALGIPVAGAHSDTRVTMVDRDLLAVRWAAFNAKANSIENMDVYGSLGFRDVKVPDSKFDWILCNVPARIGESFIAELFVKGQLLLNPSGEIRVVVINDLGPVLERISKERGFSINKIASSQKHFVYGFEMRSNPSKANLKDDFEIYKRDEVVFDGTKISRPFDMAGDTFKVEKALPLLFDVLPKKAPLNALCARSSYGLLPLVAKKRWSSTVVKTFDRDLLATSFARKNSADLGLGVDIYDCVDLREFAKISNAKNDLIFGEISAAWGEEAAFSELTEAKKLLSKDGQGLFLCSQRHFEEQIKNRIRRAGIDLTPLLSRNSFVVLRMS